MQTKIETASNEEVDAMVLGLLKKIDEKEKGIAETERPRWLTNCSFGFDPSNTSRINIQIAETYQLVDIHAQLSARKDSFMCSAVELGVRNVAFKHLGYSFEEWESDIKTRLKQLSARERQLEITTLRNRVNALVTPEQLRRIELSKLIDAV